MGKRHLAPQGARRPLCDVPSRRSLSSFLLRNGSSTAAEVRGVAWVLRPLQQWPYRCRVAEVAFSVGLGPLSGFPDSVSIRLQLEQPFRQVLGVSEPKRETDPFLTQKNG